MAPAGRKIEKNEVQELWRKKRTFPYCHILCLSFALPPAKPHGALSVAVFKSPLFSKTLLWKILNQNGGALTIVRCAKGTEGKRDSEREEERKREEGVQR